MKETKSTMDIHIYSLIEGAREARGLTVVIDVFRAFSLECWLYRMGAELIRPVETVEEAFALRDRIPGSLLVGERGGKKCDGFDFGNSPSSITPEQAAGHTFIHTTSAGTQGIANAVHADEIITGSLLNARAVAEYILGKQPREVSLVCMGNAGVRPAAEDELCALYIRSILTGEPLPDIREQAKALRTHGGEHFFNPATQDIFPEADFHICIQPDLCDFVIRVEKDELGFISLRTPSPTLPT